MSLFIESLKIGLCENYKKIINKTLEYIGIVFILTELIQIVLTQVAINKVFFMTVLFICPIIGIINSRQKKSIQIISNTMDLKIIVEFGDIFNKNGIIAISVNEYFDSIVDDKHVSPVSLHGKLIMNYFDGHPEGFDKCVDESLINVEYKLVKRPSGRERQYNIGTTAVVSAYKKKFLCVVLSKTDLTTYKASANMNYLMIALDGMLNKARDESSGNPLYIPLMGAGLSGTGINPKHILQVTIIKIIEISKKQKICDEIHIVLPENRFKEIDLDSIKRFWR